MWKSQGTEIREAILDHYYQEIYSKYLFSASVQSRGIEYFEEFVEKCWPKDNAESVARVLEIGAGQGEHWPFLRNFPTQGYYALDLRELGDLQYLNKMPTEFKEKLNFVLGNAEKIPFADNFFDRTYSTCLLHHVNEPLDVFLEARRVTKAGGDILFVMPTDPGFANQIIKKMISYRKLRKLTEYDPSLFYALEHKNISLIKFIFKADEVKFIYNPFKLPTWNFNLIVGILIRKSQSTPEYLLEEIHQK
jgi:ubiquinone/menaquinone biosynthesis C-methylase UbiE